jgi:hypothetical protein
MAGDIELAFQVLSIGIQLIWARAVNWLRDGWFSFKAIFMNSWDAITTAIAHAMVTIGALAFAAFQEISFAIQNVFVTIVGTIAREINRLIDLIPTSIRTRLGIERVNFDEEGTRQTLARDQEAARTARAATEAGLHREIDRDAGRGERERAQEHADERERARSEEADLSSRLDAAANEAFIASEMRRQGLGAELPSGPDEPYELQKGLSVQGTFNAAAVAGLAGGGVSNAERIAEASRTELTRVRELLARIAERDGAAMG